MNYIKLDEDYLGFDNSCFICLEHGLIQNKENRSSLKSFFSYLKISEFDKAVVCKQCREVIVKFANLRNVLEKVRLEMDYFLELIQSSIYGSNKNLKAAGFKDVQEAVMKSCQARIYNPRPQLILERINQSEISEFPDLSPYFDYDNSNESNQTDCPATPVVKEVKNIKLETGIPIAPGKRPRIRNMKAKCPKCPLIISKDYLKAHIERVHIGLKLFKCSICPKQFANRQSLSEHTNAIHLNLKPYKCKVCDESFTHRSSFRRHKANGHRPKKAPKPALFPCPTCNKMFTTSTIAKTHFSAVHEKQKHSCQAPGCSKIYSRESGLTEHYRQKHPDFIVPRKHPRDYLNKTFNGVNVIECKYCTINFQTVDEFKKHLKKMHKSNKFKCVYCGFKTIFKGSLQRHLKSMHNPEDKERAERYMKSLQSNDTNYEYILP